MTKPTCKIPVCDRPVHGHGWCKAHHQRWRRHGNPGTTAIRGDIVRQTKCCVWDCGNTVGAKGLCPMHYQRKRIYGSVVAFSMHGPRQKPQINPCVVEGCGKQRVSNGFCGMHNWRLKTHGELSPRKPGQVIDGKKICPHCKQDLPRSAYGSGRLVYCLPCSAARMAERRQMKPSYRLRRDILCVCRICGTEFMGNEKSNVACSAKCRKKNKRAWDYHQGALRRQQIEATQTELIVASVVFERDDWCCGICGDQVDKTLEWPDRYSVSLDHIIPLSKGGTHTYDNVQCAHLTCNASKRDTTAI